MAQLSEKDAAKDELGFETVADAASAAGVEAAEEAAAGRAAATGAAEDFPAAGTEIAEEAADGSAGAKAAVGAKACDKAHHEEKHAFDVDCPPRADLADRAHASSKDDACDSQEEEGVNPLAAQSDRRKSGVLSWLRHPLRSVRGFLDTCSVRQAFSFYAFAGMAAAFLLSLFAVSILSAAAEDILYRDRTMYPGLYIYDKDQNALVPAEKISWYEESAGDIALEEFAVAPSADSGVDPSFEVTSPSSTLSVDDAESIGASVEEGASLYVAELSSDSSHYTPIALSDVSDEAKDAVVHDIDVDEYVSLHDDDSDTRIELWDVASYDAAANARRGDVEALRQALPMNADGERPVVSLVCYYVYLPVGWLYQAVNLAMFVVVPVLFVGCFFMASRGFYKRKLQRPIQVMDEASQRIAEGDLAFNVPAPPQGSRSELDRLCVSFESMRDRLERNNKAMWRVAENRRKTNAAFAHDLRTPLTVLKGRAEMLSAFASEDALDAARLAEASSAMSRQTERLQRYVESMKELSDVDECAIDAREGDVGAWFVRAAAEAADLTQASGKDFEAKAGGLPRNALFDDVALSRVVENALSNALRYADESVRLSCEWAEGELMVSVADDGPGFDDAALKHGCEPFWRDGAEKRSENSAHFGLGLNICAELCEKHGGSVRLFNAEGGGAVVEARVEAPLV